MQPTIPIYGRSSAVFVKHQRALSIKVTRWCTLHKQTSTHAVASRGIRRSAYTGALSLPPSSPDGNATDAAASVQQQTAGEQQTAVAALRPPEGPGSTAALSYGLALPNWQPLTGVSKQHAKIVREVSKAAASRAPLLITADRGIDTLKLAATIHALSLTREDSNRPLVEVNCSTPEGQQQAQQLLSNALHGDHNTSDRALLQYLEGGTLVLSNIHKAPQALLTLASEAVGTLMRQHTSDPSLLTAPAGCLLHSLNTRLILISQLPAGQLTGQMATQPDHRSGLAHCSSISVPPLRARASDIAPLALQAARPTAATCGYADVALTDAAVLQISGYHWPGNEVELQGMVQRAVLLHPPAQTPAISNTSTIADAATLVLDAADFQPAIPEADRHRVDILELLPWLKPLMLDTGLWPVGMNRIMTWMYPLIIASLFLGPQDRESSAALTAFWAGWWPLVLLSFPFVGRAWCAMCPFMITGQKVQHLVGKDVAPVAATPAPAGASASATFMGSHVMCSQGPEAGQDGPIMEVLRSKWQHLLHAVPEQWGWRKWNLQKWPTDEVATWGNWLMVLGFAAILCWEEVDDLPNSAALSGWLLLLITAGAVAFSMVFEKRLWCRHLCPIGGMNGLFAKLSMTEIRSRPGICAAAACSRHCHKGRVVTGSAAASRSMMAEHHSLSLAQALGNGGNKAREAAAAGQDVGATAGNTAAITAALQLPGCPMNSYPAKHVDNQVCVMCANCLRSCPSGSVQWRLRPPAADLWRDHTAAWHEMSLMFVLLGAVLLHRLPQLCDQLGLPQDIILEQQGPHLAASLALLAAPGAIVWLWDKAAGATSRWLQARADSRPSGQLTAAAAAWDTVAPAASSSSSSSSSGSSNALTPVQQAAAGSSSSSNSSGSSLGSSDALALVQQAAAGTAAAVRPGSDIPYLKLAYSYLPLIWSASLAHYEQLMLSELGLVLPRLAVSLGADPSASWLAMLPVVGPAPEPVISAAQGLTLLLGLAASCALAGKIAAVEGGPEGAGKAVAHHRVLMLAAAAELWHLIV